METIGRVVSTNNEFAKIEVMRTSACGEKCSSCGGGCSKTGMYIDVKNTLNAKSSQFIKVEIETKTIMKAGFLVYILPLFMLIIGAVSGYYIHGLFNMTFPSDLFSLLLGVLFLGLSYGIVRIFDRNYNSKGKIQYKMTKIL
ncbi:SoxR reducing system RseC family protein [Anaeromicrobium sediminis]|uniref:Fis family transcriptional regulator n=1 Tax=Anaeromicrobium sediminis TaxID=1478221 RepID=A0A267MII5_9FIRM|nr:SoxR reducing system RseC family protein [Anaeromicrobium sediminis]PAB58610.1 hypothetical protein CCE28_14090 [Anaeromicrobium sediminis]